MTRVRMRRHVALAHAAARTRVNARGLSLPLSCALPASLPLPRQGLGMKRRSQAKAFLHFFQAASLGHPQAMFNVAMMHLAGKGTPKACRPALVQLKALVEKGHLAAAVQAAHEAFFRGQHSQVRATGWRGC